MAEKKFGIELRSYDDIFKTSEEREEDKLAKMLIMEHKAILITGATSGCANLKKRTYKLVELEDPLC